MKNNQNISCSDVLKRLCAALGVESDVELAKALGVANNTISGWRTRNKIPYEKVIEVSLDNGFTVDQLLFGDSPVNKPKQVNGKLELIKSFATEQAQQRLFFYTYEKLNAEFPLQEQLASGEIENVLSQIWNSFSSIEKQVPNLLDRPLEDIYEIADVIIADDIQKYNELIKLVKSRGRSPE